MTEQSEPEATKPFAEMAQAIQHNSGQGFGGAVVIVPPTGGGAPISILILDSQGDLAQFYSTIQSRLQMRLADIDNKQRGLPQGFPSR